MEPVGGDEKEQHHGHGSGAHSLPAAIASAVINHMLMRPGGYRK